MSFNYNWKNLTRTDLIQYDGEKFINVPAYSVRDKVRWEKEEIEQANLRINNSIKTVALLGHKHQISDIENLQNILNIIEGSDANWSSLVNISTFNNHVNNLGPNKHLTQEQINILFSGSGSGSGGNSFWTFVDTDENGNSLETPYIKTEYPVVSEKNITAYKKNTDELESLVLFSLGDAVDVNLTGVAVDNLLKYNGTHWVNVPMSSLDVGTKSSWGTTSNNYSTLIVDDIEKTVALQGHTHNYLPLTGGTLTGNLTAPLFIGALSGNASSATNAGYLRVIASRTGSETWLPDDNSVDTQKLKVYDVYAQAGTPSTYGNVLEINGIANHWKPQLWFDGSSHNIRYRNRGYNSTTWLPWKLIAFTDSNVASATTAANLNRSVLAGNGLTGGGVLDANRTITLGTPSNITLSSTNSVGTSNHTHNLALGGTSSQYLNGTTSLVTIPTITAGNGLSGGGQLTQTRTLSLGTPSTLNNTTTNSVGTSSHTHAITTTTVGSANTIVATDAYGGVRGNLIRIGGNWTLELSGTELLFKYNGVTKQRMFQDGSFSATGEVAAYSQGTAADELQLNKLTLLQGGGISKYLSSTATQVYFDIDGASPLAMSKTEVRRGTSYSNVNLGTSAYPWMSIYGVNLIASTHISTPKITLGNGWTIEQTSASLTIRRNGVVKGTFNT